MLLIRPKLWSTPALPAAGVQIDWGHPLARALELAVVMDGGSAVSPGKELVHGVRGRSSGGTPAVQNLRNMGPGLVPSASGGWMVFSHAAGAAAFPLPMTCLGFTDYVSPSAGQGGFAGSAVNGGGGWWIGNSGGPGVVQWTASAIANVNSSIPYPTGPSCVAASVSLAEVLFFANGETDVVGYTGGMNANAAFYVGQGRNDGALLWGGAVGPVYVWSRNLPADELLWLQAEPYAFLQAQSPNQRYWFEIGGSGALAVALPVGAFASGIASLTAAALTASSPLGAFANGITSAGGGATTDALSLGAVVGGIGSSSGAALANALPAGAFASGLGTASTGAGVQINALSLGGFVGGIGSVRGGATVTGISIGGFAAGSGKFAAGASTLAVPSGAFAAGLGTASTGTTVQVNALSLGAFASGLGFVGADAAVAAMSSGSFTYGLSSISAGTTLSALPSGAFASGVATPIISVSLSITPLGAVASAIGDVSSGAVLVSTPRGAFGAGIIALTATAALNAVPLGAFVAGVSTAAVIGAITIGCVSVIDGIVTTISVSDGSC